MKRIIFLSILFLLCLLPCVVDADTLLYQPNTTAGDYRYYTTEQPWATLRNTTADSGDSGNVIYGMKLDSGPTNTVSGKYLHLYRGYWLTNTSGIPDTATVTSAKLGVYKWTSSTALGNLEIGISNNSGTAAYYYDDWVEGTVSNYIAINSFTSKWTNFTINVNVINKQGMTRLQMRSRADIENNESLITRANSSTSQIGVYTISEVSNKKPYLEIVYTPADSTPPLSITNLTNITTTCEQITFTFNKSTSSDLNYTYIMKDNVFHSNISNSTESVTFSGLTGGQSYTFSSKTVDITGNMNASWVNMTAVAVACAGCDPISIGFTSNVTNGTAPLAVSFTNQTTNTTGYTWYFGDENYNQSWVEQTNNAEWGLNIFHSMTSLPDGSLIVAGGYNGSSSVTNNQTWRSTDKGVTWTLKNASGGWSSRTSHQIIGMKDGSIVLMGGSSAVGVQNDTWRSTDEGETWTLKNASSGWEKRTDIIAVAMPDDSILIVGGTGALDYFNDTWRSTDYGATWTLMSATAPFQARNLPKLTAMKDGSAVFLGGYVSTGNLSSPDHFFNDVWRSTDYGVTWTQTKLETADGWAGREEPEIVTMPDNSILLMGGYNNSAMNDTWRSTDYGATWTLVDNQAEWKARTFHATTTVSSDGSVILSGGSAGSDYFKDVWRLQPAGSTSQNPAHIYTEAGNYSVVLVANSSCRVNQSTPYTYWINVTSGGISPIASFIVNKEIIRFPNNVTVNDTSTNTPTSWSWDWGDGTAYDTTRNSTHQYTKRGKYPIVLNASNAQGSNISAATSVRVIGYETYSN